MHLICRTQVYSVLICCLMPSLPFSSYFSTRRGREGSNRSRIPLKSDKSYHLQRLHEYERQHDFVKDLTEVIFPKHLESLLSNVLFFLISRQRAAACFICLYQLVTISMRNDICTLVLQHITIIFV